MKILIIAKRPTHPADSGSRRFILNQVESFKRMGHDVHYFYIHEEWHPKRWGNNDYINQMKAFWGDKLHLRRVTILTILWYYFLIGLRVVFRHGRQKVDDTYPWFLGYQVNELQKVHHFDCCIINYYELSRLFTKIDIPLKAITTHDYFSYKTLLVGKRYVKASTDAHQEAIAMQRCPHIFALNTEEAIYFSKLSPFSKVYNVFSIYQYRECPVVGNKVMLFLSGNNPYNVNGLRWFINDIFPLIIKEHTDAELWIAGSICKLLTDLSNHPNIKLFGYVKDEKTFYDKADVVINPTYQGTGLKIKTFEAIAYDKITIVHPHSMTGIYKPEEAPVFASSEAQDLVDYLDKVWSNKEHIKDIKKKNKRYLEEMQLFVEHEYQRFFASQI